MVSTDRLLACVNKCDKELLKEILPSCADETGDIGIQFCESVIRKGVEDLFLGEEPLMGAELSHFFSLVGGSSDAFVSSIIADTEKTLWELKTDAQQLLAKALDLHDFRHPREILEQIKINGLDALLAAMNPSLMERFASEIGLPKGNRAAEDVIDQIFPPKNVPVPVSPVKEKQREHKPKKDNPVRESKKEKPKRKRSPSPQRFSRAEQYADLKKTRPPLSRGISIEQIQNCYWVDELREFCKDAGLKATGKKTELNKRVYAHLHENKKDSPKRRKRDE